MVTELKQGKWYKDTAYGYGARYAKFEVLKGSFLYFTEMIYTAGLISHSYYNGNWEYRSDRYIEVSIDEISKYLPKNHPDLKSLENNEIILW